MVIYPEVEIVHYFSDRYAKQYKNYKNLLNLCYHKDDFNVAADWSFLATSHDKSACDGIGATVKRLTATASLQRPFSDQILLVDAKFKFCTENVPATRFLNVTKDEVINRRGCQEV